MAGRAYHRYWSANCGLAALAMALAAGCQPQLPTYPRVDAQEALRLMADRTAHIESVSAPCRVVLTQSDGRSVQLDGAMVSRPPDYLRLRAWKLSRPVFDLTLRPDGLWIFRAKGSADDQPWSAESLTAARLRRAWSLLTARMDQDAWTLTQDAGDRLVVSTVDPDDHYRVECVADRDTLTLQRCTIADADGGTHVTLTWEAYRLVDGLVWPLQVRMEGDAGSITVTTDPPTFNDPPPTEAFTPPSRAVKQP
jgi:hypothetical protein